MPGWLAISPRRSCRFRHGKRSSFVRRASRSRALALAAESPAPGRAFLAQYGNLWPHKRSRRPAATNSPSSDFVTSLEAIFLARGFWLVLRQFLRRNMQAGADSERQRPKLGRAHAGLQIDHIAAYQSEGNLRHDKPEPIDPLIQNRADNTQRRIHNSGKQQRRHEARGKNRISGKHRQHGAIPQARSEEGLLRYEGR